ncbi:MAG: squalene synthase HpnC [Thermoguttaceae bacterium]
MFHLDLKRYGPDAQPGRILTLAQARKYCKHLAREHYENFTLVSWLLPRRLCTHFYNIYAYCRWADDLADEFSDPQESLDLLDWWETQLNACYQGQATHPVFIALAETINAYNIPSTPFCQLLAAFRQDQRINRYQTFGQLLEYCRHSANPVGHLVLYLAECYTSERVTLADSICTGLQLANFCQDVAQDWQRSRIYLPLEDCNRYEYTEDMFAREEYNPAFRDLMRFEVARAENFLSAGNPLIKIMPPKLKLDVKLFIEGGLAILRAIRSQNYDVWTRRPTVSKMTKLFIFFHSWLKLQ